MNQNRTKTKTNPSNTLKNTTEFTSPIGCWVWIYNQWDSRGESYFFLCECLSIGDSVSVSDWSLCSRPLSVLGPRLAYTQAGPVHTALTSVSCMCDSHVVSKRPCVLGVFHPLWLLQFLSLLFCRVACAPREGFDRDIPSKTECSRVSRSAHCPGVGLCISFLLLQESW